MIYESKYRMLIRLADSIKIKVGSNIVGTKNVDVTVHVVLQQGVYCFKWPHIDQINHLKSSVLVHRVCKMSGDYLKFTFFKKNQNVNFLLISQKL